jgi:hypothetical protein
VEERVNLPAQIPTGCYESRARCLYRQQARSRIRVRVCRALRQQGRAEKDQRDRKNAQQEIRGGG